MHELRLLCICILGVSVGVGCSQKASEDATTAATTLRASAISASTGAADVAVSGNNPLASLHFRFLGPNGNRDIAVVGVPGDPQTAYFGAASGGIWKTTDGGAHFQSIFDSMDVSSIGTLALAPSNPNIVWAGTGEPYIIREATSVGDGVYKSTDAGHTWKHMGLEQTGHISNIAIDPTNANIVYVCAVGQGYTPNAERGVYRSKDGGTSWNLVLKVNSDTGCSGLSMDLGDPKTLFASTWQLETKPWDLGSGGPGSGLFVTHDSGNTWNRLSGHGLPPEGTILGKTAVRVAPTNGKIVYALMEGETGLLYRSADGGQNWTLVQQSDDLGMRAPYYMDFSVSTSDEDMLYFPQVEFQVSRDGGRTVTAVKRAGKATTGNEFVYPGGDSHSVWIDPKNAKRVLVADDSGGAMTLNGGQSWFKVNLPIAQIYHVYTDSSIPYNVIGNRQDSGGQEGPSRALNSSGFGGGAGTIPASAWHGYNGCESGFGIPDPGDPSIIWSGCYNGDMSRIDLRTGQARNVSVWPVASFGTTPSMVRDRWNWSFPIAISPSNHNKVYTGSQYLYQTTDAGQNWKRISPDLTTGKNLGNSGKLTVDNLMTFSSGTLAMIDESPVKAGVIWTGSYDGQVNVTQDGGTHWENVTANIKNLLPSGTINLEASPYDAGTAYVTSNRKMMGDYAPHIFKTTDYGKTWTDHVGDMPHSVFSFVHVVREDPVRKGMLYAGTENALYVSWDDGDHWTRLRNNFPPAPVYWLQIQPTFNDLVIATFGRGIWVLDDITALRSWDTVSRAGQNHLFTPRAAYRFRKTFDARQENPNGATSGENISYGADLNYYLSAPGAVAISITNSDGKVVNTLKAKGIAGLNRIFWNLRYDGLTEAKLLTDPPGKSFVKTPADGRPLVVWGKPSSFGPLVPPGIFTVGLSVDGMSVGSQPLKVLPDPHTLGTQPQMVAQAKFLLEVRDDVNQVVALVNQFEVTRKDIKSVRQNLGSGSRADKLRAAADKLNERAIAIEGKLFGIHNAGLSEDSFRENTQLYEQIGTVYNNLNSKGDTDQGPTAAEVEVIAELQGKLAAVQHEAEDFVRVDVAAFNAVAEANGGKAITTR